MLFYYLFSFCLLRAIQANIIHYFCNKKCRNHPLLCCICKLAPFLNKIYATQFQMYNINVEFEWENNHHTDIWWFSGRTKILFTKLLRYQKKLYSKVFSIFFLGVITIFNYHLYMWVECLAYFLHHTNNLYIIILIKSVRTLIK